MSKDRRPSWVTTLALTAPLFASAQNTPGAGPARAQAVQAQRMETVTIPVSTTEESLAQLDKVVTAVKALHEEGKVIIKPESRRDSGVDKIEVFEALAESLRGDLEAGRLGQALDGIRGIKFRVRVVNWPKDRKEFGEKVSDLLYRMERDTEARQMAGKDGKDGNITSVTLQVPPLAESIAGLKTIIDAVERHHAQGTIEAVTNPFILGTGDRYDDLIGSLRNARRHLIKDDIDILAAWGAISLPVQMPLKAKSIDDAGAIGELNEGIKKIALDLRARTLAEINSQKAKIGGKSR